MSRPPLQALAARARAGTLTAAERTALAHDPRAGARRLAAALAAAAARAAADATRQAALRGPEEAAWARGHRHVAGVDEAGCGPLAGPVVAAAVVLPAALSLPGLDDSKRLSAAARAQLAAAIRAGAIAWGLGSCSPEEIDRLNIYHAAREAMRRAVRALPVPPCALLVDARRVPGVAVPQTAIVGGDGLSRCIAAASIVAKVARDATMAALAERYPAYGFAAHAGYGTPAHLAALAEHGPSPVHRRSFAPVARAAARVPAA